MFTATASSINSNNSDPGMTRRRLSWAINEKSPEVIAKKSQEMKQNSAAPDNEGNVNELRSDLMRLIIGEDHLFKIKVQYLDERTALNLQRPVNFQELEQYFQTKYGRLLNFYYTTSTKELMIQIRNQKDLDDVIQLHERSVSSKHRMRLILSQKREQSEQTSSPLRTQPPMGMHHAASGSAGGITECALSDTSSIWSMISGSSSKRTPGGTQIRMSSWPEEKSGSGMVVDTPQPPMNWREGRCLGRGAFGHVYVCLNVDTGEQQVVKKIYLRGNNRQRSRVLATLQNELNMLGSLHHPHIVQYFGVVERHDCINIFMELMAGGSLKDQISEYGAISEPLCIHFMKQILSGLQYLHSKDIVHRDIKPANILRHTRAHVKIGDFGSAKFLQAMCSEQGVDIQGTPHYTAPEIVRDARRYEPRSDVWSVGITVLF